MILAKWAFDKWVFAKWVFARCGYVAGVLAGSLALSLFLVSPLQAQEFGTQKVITTNADRALSVYAQDLTGDEDADVLSASARDDKIAWYENEGDGAFSTQRVITTSAEGPLSVYAQDLDGDGDADVLSASVDDDKIAWHENEGSGTFSDQKVITTSADTATSVYAQDLDGDGDADILSASAGDDKIAWYENEGQGTFSSQKVITTNAETATSVYAQDLDGDGDADVLSASADDDKIAWYENEGDGTFSNQKVITTDAEVATSVYAQDLDGDGNADVLSASARDDKIAWYENEGSGTFSDQKVITTSAATATSVYAKDLDGDGDADVLSASAGDDKIAWYENEDDGTFSGQEVINTPDPDEDPANGTNGNADGAHSVYAQDLDGDGDADVLSASAFDDKIAWYERTPLLQVSISQSFEEDQKFEYRLVALPGRAEGSLSETVSGNWRGFREEGASGDQAYSRSRCAGNCQFGPGKGFWLIARQAWQVERTVEPVSLGENGTTGIGLQDGWNVVSNPLDVDVSWNAVQQSTGTSQLLWRWDGSWQQASTFVSAKSGEAYYFRDDQISELTVPSPEASGEATARVRSDTVSVKKRALTLSLIRGGEAVTSVRAGIRPEAKPGLDRYDLYGPPGYSGATSLRLLHEGEKRPEALAAEYRGPGGEGYSFNIRLRSPSDTALALRPENLSAFNGREVVLVEESTGESHDLRDGEAVTIVPTAEETCYRLLIGSEAYVEGKKREIRPSKLKLLPSYPNPFSEQTTIEYALPEAREVRLVAYDVLGRRVVTLSNGQKKEGFHRVQWEPARKLPSGTYFLRLRAGGQAETRKVTIVR